MAGHGGARRGTMERRGGALARAGQSQSGGEARGLPLPHLLHTARQSIWPAAARRGTTRRPARVGPLLDAVLLCGLPRSSAPPLRGGDLLSGRRLPSSVRGGSRAGRPELPRRRRTFSPAAASPLCRVHGQPLPSPSSSSAVEMRQREGAEDEVDLQRRSHGGGAKDELWRRSLWRRPPPSASTSAPCSEAGQERWGQRGLRLDKAGDGGLPRRHRGVPVLDEPP
ncbi:unnamed protein product [Urochloa humidicola]